VSLKLAEVDSSPIRYRHFGGNAAPVEAKHATSLVISSTER
jgi:hypothetical protein